MAAVDRLRSFYGDQLLCRTGTFASTKSFGSAASGAASASGAETSGLADGAKQHRPGDEDLVIDPYQLDPDGSSSSSSDDDDDRLSRPDSGSGQDEDDGELDDTEWTSASGDEARPEPGPGSIHSAVAASRRGGGGGRSVAGMSARAAPSTKSRKALPAVAVSGAHGTHSVRGVSIIDEPQFQGPKGPRSVAASNWGARSRRSAACSASASAVSSTTLSAVPSGAPGGAVSVQKLDARLKGRVVQRRLQRRRGWEFDLVPDEVDYTLGRELPHVLTRPQPTADSDEESEEGDDDVEDDSLGARASGSPPRGPLLEAIKTYAHERAPEVVWSERVKHAKRVARQTGQTVTVRGRLEPKKRRELARKIQKWDNREWFNSRKRAPPAPPLHPAVERVIEQWFQLVDDDGGGTLDREELLTALQASDVPVKPENIDEMIALMDLDRDGVISWKEFVTFFMYEFAAGKNLLSGEYVLPSGVALPFGAMIAKLKRDRLVADLVQGGTARARWQNIAESPIALEDELGMMAAVELAMEEMKNPALGRARARAAKALSKLPAHLRTPSIARHLQRHPEVADKLLRAPSMAALMAASSLKRAPSATNIMARLASTNSNGSMASRNSSMAGGGAGSTGGGSTGGGGGGGGASSGRVGNVDLNVAVALAAGLEWPVEGASFYNKRAKTVLRAACQKPPDAILRAVVPAGAAGAAVGAAARNAPSPAPAKDTDTASRSAAGLGTAAHGSFRKQASGLKVLSVEAVATASATAAAVEDNLPKSRGLLRAGGAGGSARRGSRRRDASNSGDEAASSGARRHGGAGADSDSDEMLPWLVNAKRREEEERQELRERLMGGASSKSAAAAVLEDSSVRMRRDAGAARVEEASPRRTGLPEGEGDEEDGLWVSPLLKRWLTVERERLKKPLGELAAPSTEEPSPAVPTAANISRAGSTSTTLVVEVSAVDDGSLTAVRAVSGTLDGDSDATPVTARKPRRRMRFVDEQMDSALSAPEDTPVEDDSAVPANGTAAASAAGLSPLAVLLASPHACAVGQPQAEPAHPAPAAAAATGASLELLEDPSTSELRSARRSLLLSGGPGAYPGAADMPLSFSPHPTLPNSSPRGPRQLHTSSLVDAPSNLNAGDAGAESTGTSPLRASYNLALQQWAMSNGPAAAAQGCSDGSLEPLDAEEAHELMAGMTLQLSKEEALYHIHTGHEADRPTTSDFRAALTRMRLAAAALVQSYALPPHPEASGAKAPAAGGLSPEASQPQGPLHGHGPAPGGPAQQPRTQPQCSESPSSATAALSARPSAVSILGAQSAGLSYDRCRGQAHSGSGVAAEGPSSGRRGGAGVSARSRGAKAAKQVVARAPELVVAGVSSAARQQSLSPQKPSLSAAHSYDPYSSAFAHSPHLSYAGVLQNSINPEAGQPYRLNIPSSGDGAVAMPAPVDSTGTGAAGPAQGERPSQPQPPCYSPDPGILAAAIATARSMSRAGSSRPASRARSPSPLGARSQSPIRVTTSQPGSRQETPVPASLFAPGSYASTSGDTAVAYIGDICASAAQPEGFGVVPQTHRSLSTGAPGSLQAQPPTLAVAWDARVAALLQRHTAVELAAVRRSSSPPDAGIATGSKSARPADTGGRARSVAHGVPSGLGPGAVALLTSRRAAGHAQLLRGVGSVLPARAKSSLGLLRGSEGHGTPVNMTGYTPEPSPTTASRLAGSSSVLLLPLDPSGPLPEFIHMPGAMPRLQSRYAAKRARPSATEGEAAAAVALAPAAEASPEHVRAASGSHSRSGSRGGSRLPDPLAQAEQGIGDGDSAATANAVTASPLWQVSGVDEDEDEAVSPRGWGTASTACMAGRADGQEVNSSSAHVTMAVAAQNVPPSEVPDLSETLSCATDLMTSRPPSAASSVVLVRPREHLLLHASLPDDANRVDAAAVALQPAARLHSPCEPEQSEPVPQGSITQAPGLAESQHSRRDKLMQPRAQHLEVPPQPLQPNDAPSRSGEATNSSRATGQADETLTPVDSDKASASSPARRQQQQQQHGKAHGDHATSLTRRSNASPAGPEPNATPASGHAVPLLSLHTLTSGAPGPVAQPVAAALLSPYSGGTMLASGLRLPNPSRLKAIPATIPGADVPGFPPAPSGGTCAAAGSAFPPGGMSPASAPPIAGASDTAGSGQTSRLVGELAVLAGKARGSSDGGISANTAGRVTVYLPAVGAGEAEPRLEAGRQLPMFPPLTKELGAPESRQHAVWHRIQHLPGGQARAAAGTGGGGGGGPGRRGYESESLPALPLRSLSHEGELSPLSPSPRMTAEQTALGGTDTRRGMLGPPAPAYDRLVQPPPSLGTLLRAAQVPGGSAPQPFSSGPTPVSKKAGHGARRRAAWGEPKGGGHNLGTAMPAAHLSAPWVEQQTTGSTFLLPGLPDIVTLLSREPPKTLRTGPIRIEKIDI